MWFRETEKNPDSANLTEKNRKARPGYRPQLRPRCGSIPPPLRPDRAWSRCYSFGTQPSNGPMARPTCCACLPSRFQGAARAFASTGVPRFGLATTTMPASQPTVPSVTLVPNWLSVASWGTSLVCRPNLERVSGRQDFQTL